MYLESCLETNEPIPQPGTWAGTVQVKIPGPGGAKRTERYIVVYEDGPGNWSAYVPDVPGCIATGKTRQATEKRIKEAIEFHLEDLAEDGEPIPEPGTWTSIVEVDVPGGGAAKDGTDVEAPKPSRKRASA